jgi:hypothetical protein
MQFSNNAHHFYSQYNLINLEQMPTPRLKYGTFNMI